MVKRKPKKSAPLGTTLTHDGAPRALARSDFLADPDTLAKKARKMTDEAIGEQSPYLAERALGARSEARVSHAVAQFRTPDLPGRDDAGPYGPARGCLEIARVDVREGHVVRQVKVSQRALTRTLAKLSVQHQAIARHYQALVAQIGAVRCMNPAEMGGGGGHKSDGGAVARLGDAQELGWILEAIGDGTALYARNGSAHADRARRSIKARELVDAVCLEEMSIQDVLARFGWSRKHQNVQALMTALRQSLDRAYQASILGIDKR